MKDKFKLPFMVLHRDDLISAGYNKNYSDEQMQRIADKLGKHLAQDWDIIIDAIASGDPELFEVE